MAHAIKICIHLKRKKESSFLQSRIRENVNYFFQKYTDFNQKQIGYRNRTHIQNHQNF